MASLHRTPSSPSHLVAGWLLQSEHPAVLAAVPDAISQQLKLTSDVVAFWALHPDEQAGSRAAAYEDELREIGGHGTAQVLELVRPWQQNVVWVDRYHLVAWSVPAPLASRLLGLYVGSKGSCALYLHEPSVTAALAAHVQAVATAPTQARWDHDPAVLQSRIAVHWSGSGLELRCPPALAGPVDQALARLATHVQGW